MEFQYNESGHRIKKLSYNANGQLLKTTFYVRDAAGTPIAIYYKDEGNTDKSVILAEQVVYGGSRLGTLNRTTETMLYEIKDHLGNVRAIVTKAESGELIAVLGTADYYPFGMPFPDEQNLDYRYAYQGQEKDEETNMEAFQLRLWDARIGRWLTPDPYGQYASPYLGMGNNPINGTDPDGGFFEGGDCCPGETDGNIGAVTVTGSRKGSYFKWFDIFKNQYYQGLDWDAMVPTYNEHGEYAGDVTKKDFIRTLARNKVAHEQEFAQGREALSKGTVELMLVIGSVPMTAADGVLLARGLYGLRGLLAAGGTGVNTTRGSAPQLFSSAISQFKNTNLTNAGRAVTKHPQYFGFKSTETLMKVHNTPTALNKLGAQSLKNILRNGVRTTGAGGRYPEGWVTYTLKNGNAASWTSDGIFIGFRGIK